MIGERRRGCVRAGAGRSREHNVDADGLLVSFPVLLGSFSFRQVDRSWVLPSFLPKCGQGKEKEKEVVCKR